MPGFRSLRLSRCVERPSRYLLLVEWRELEDHTEGFRGSPEYEAWRALLHHFYDPFPTVEHYEDIECLRLLHTMADQFSNRFVSSAAPGGCSCHHHSADSIGRPAYPATGPGRGVRNLPGLSPRTAVIGPIRFQRLSIL